MVVVIDYGMGNIRSIVYKLHKMKVDTIASADPQEIDRATRLILPGVGHFAKGMENLKELNLISILNKKVLEDKVPILGICLGIQLFTQWSEEGDCEGLGWIDADTRKFTFEKNVENVRIPHVGWNTLGRVQDCVLLDGIQKEQKFYFTHSYHLHCKIKKDVVATTNYGYPFASCIQRDNIFGTQFHPEKSHFRGFEVINNFFKDR